MRSLATGSAPVWKNIINKGVKSQKKGKDERKYGMMNQGMRKKEKQSEGGNIIKQVEKSVTTS